MIKRIFTLSLVICLCFLAQSQNIGIGTTSPNTSAALDISSAARGLLIPRMTITGITAISGPAKGLMVYDSLQNQLMVNMGTPTAPNWQTIVLNSGWGLNGNSGAGNSFIGTTDGAPLLFKVSNTKAGYIDPTSKTANTSFGFMALNSLTTGVLNSAIGYQALSSNTNGVFNTASGYQSLYSNVSGDFNTASGIVALYSNISGSDNTAFGADALYSNNSNQNTAIGSSCLTSNTTGAANTANGYVALFDNTTGSKNTATGNSSLYVNQTGSENTADGYSALSDNLAGNYNTAVGVYSLSRTSAAYYNTAIGYNAGASHDLGYNNTILGANCDAAFSGAYNDIAIGQSVTCTDNSQARIGNAATSSIGGYANWTNISDGRYKKNLKENVQGLAFIMKLRPVTYNLDITGLSNKLNESRGKPLNNQMRMAIAEKELVTQTGFVAQEVEQAAKETGYEFSGIDKPKTDVGLYGLRYAEFVVPLVKAMQEQQQIIETMKKRMDALEEQNKLLQQLVNKKN